MNVIGIDVGGTSVKGARVGHDGAVAATAAVPTPHDAEALTVAVIEVAWSLRTDDTAAIGVVSPGVLDDGVVRYAANLPWRDEPVRDRVRAAHGLPVVLGRDVAAAALAESESDALFVALGTGIAAAHVLDGVVRGGATGRAGEIGHAPVARDGEPCACGQIGCLEVYASAAGLARRYAARTGRTLDAAAIAHTPDGDAAVVWHDAIDALATALATQVLTLDPAVIVLGGGLAAAGDALFEPLRAALAARLAWRPAPPIRAARLGPAAGCIGAARLAWSTAATEVLR